MEERSGLNLGKVLVCIQCVCLRLTLNVSILFFQVIRRYFRKLNSIFKTLLLKLRFLPYQTLMVPCDSLYRRCLREILILRLEKGPIIRSNGRAFGFFMGVPLKPWYFKVIWGHTAHLRIFVYRIIVGKKWEAQSSETFNPSSSVHRMNRNIRSIKYVVQDYTLMRLPISQRSKFHYFRHKYAYSHLTTT